MVRFRVGRNMRKATVRVLVDGKEAYKRPRPVMAPGEMEQVLIKKAWFSGEEKEITVEATDGQEGK